ncbi:MAG: hypothetical protein IJ275_01580 [Ruminococcus sp.]|nr:hypothetical protein [Ruminococcus sp.]
MKKISLLLAVVICVATLFCGCGTNNDEVVLKTGNYDSIGMGYIEVPEEFKGNADPCLYLDTEEMTFIYSFSPSMSYAEYGTYTVQDGTLIASAPIGKTYTFEIKDENTLAIVDNDGNILEEFVYSEK